MKRDDANRSLVDELLKERKQEQARENAEGDAYRSEDTMKCDGSRYCEAETHLHGCFADKGKCDTPDEHKRPVPRVR